jgi:hypothetical protein
MDVVMNLLTFPTPAPKSVEINEDAIAMLEVWLERLRSGETTSVAVAGITSEGYTSTSFAGTPQELLAAVDMLHHRMIVTMYDHA